jgi:hypothetical protein
MLLSILFTSPGLGECLKKANASAGWLAGVPFFVKHCLDFSFVFSAPLPA